MLQRFKRPRWNTWLITLNVLLLVAMLLLILLWIHMTVGGYREPGSRARDIFTNVWFYSPVAVIVLLIATLIYASIRIGRAQKARAVSL